MEFNKLVIVCFTIVGTISAIATSVYHINDRHLMSKNIEHAIEKGIDPVLVRCSYAGKDDIVCITFATNASHNKDSVIKSIDRVTKKK